MDEGFPHSSNGGSIRVGGGTSDGFPNDPFGRPFLLTIRANPKNRRQNGQHQKGNSNNGNRSRRRRPSSPSSASNTVSRQVHGSLHQQSVHQGPGHLLNHQVMGGGQFMIHPQQGTSMFNGASSSDGSFVPLSAFIIPPQQNSMSPNSMNPNSMSPNSMNPNSMSPNSMSPNSMSPNSMNPLTHQSLL